MSEKENVVMKKFLRFIPVLLLVLGLPLAAAAAELTGCRISADSVSGRPGEEVTIPVRIGSNPGFTNFGIALDYDREAMTLVSIRLADDSREPYLCGSFAAANIAWDPALDANAEDFSEDALWGYVVCVQPEAVSDDGILFTATFHLADSFSGTAEVTPVVNYLRNNEALFSVFETVNAQTEPATVTAEGAAILIGDVNQDGYITADDAATAFAASKGALDLTEEQKIAADANGDGYITADDAAQIFAMSKSNQ